MTLPVSCNGRISNSNLTNLKLQARLTGFEPVTVRLEGGCSIQLSYRRCAPSQLASSRREVKSGLKNRAVCFQGLEIAIPVVGFSS